MDKHPFISIPLDIPDVRVRETEITAQRELVLTVESTLTSTSCRRCGRTITEFPRLFQRLTLDLEGYRRFSPWRTPTSRAAHGKS